MAISGHFKACIRFAHCLPIGAYLYVTFSVVESCLIIFYYFRKDTLSTRNHVCLPSTTLHHFTDQYFSFTISTAVNPPYFIWHRSIIYITLISINCQDFFIEEEYISDRPILSDHTFNGFFFIKNKKINIQLEIIISLYETSESTSNRYCNCKYWNIYTCIQVLSSSRISFFILYKMIHWANPTIRPSLVWQDVSKH